MNAPRAEHADPRNPLLRAIQSEVNERLCQIRSAVTMLEALLPVRRHHARQIARLHSELSLHRREMRRVREELAQLGASLEDEGSSLLQAPYEWRAASLEATGFGRS